MAGAWDKAKGKVKEGVGKVTGDESTEAEGKGEQTLGEGKEKWDETKEKGREAVGHGRDEYEERT